MKLNVRLLSVLFWLILLDHQGHAQYFSKTYRIWEDREKGSFFLYAFPTDQNSIVTKDMYICPNNQGCFGIKHLNIQGVESKESVKNYMNGNRHSMKMRNDTIFYSGRSISAVDSIFYWYFGMMTVTGDSIAEYKYPIIHLEDGDVINYGLVLTGGSEAILWGEGIDNRQPNPTNVPYRSVFYRVGFDGSVRSDLIWYERNTNTSRRMSDAATDIDGNPVFGYFCVEGALRRYFIKLLPDNTVTTGVYVDVANAGLDDPRIAIDHEGNYLINSFFLGKDSIWNNDKRRTTHVTKINRQGEILWSTMMPQIKREGEVYLDRFEMLRMSVTKNNDILCVGQVIISDTFYNLQTNEPHHWVSLDASFIARLSSDGIVKWRHLMAPLDSEGFPLANILFDIQEAPDGSIIAAGNLQRDTIGFINDAWLLRLNPDGCLNEECDHIQKYWYFPDTISTTQEISFLPVEVYPNPGNEYLFISSPKDIVYPVQYELMNQFGQRFQTGFLETMQDTVDTSWMHSGVYVILLKDKDGKIFSGKWVKSPQ